MPELTSFSYRHRESGLQLLDARVKLAALVGLSAATAQAGLLGLSLASLLGAVIVWKSGISLVRLMRELRYLAAFSVCIWAVRSLTTPGDGYVQFASLTISRAGLLSGALLSWRLMLIAVLGFGLTATTPSSRIRSAIEWFLRPIPGIPHQTLGTMIGLLVRFIPVILYQSREVQNAQRARAVENRKNPVYRMVKLGMPLLRHSFVTADRLACAMEARGYNSHRTSRPWKANATDVWALIAVSGLCVLMVLV